MGVLWAAAAAQDLTGRALPLAWLVRHGQQGHVPADFPMALVEQVSQLRPEGTQVVGLGASRSRQRAPYRGPTAASPGRTSRGAPDIPPAIVAFEGRSALPCPCTFRPWLLDIECTEDPHRERLRISQYRLDRRTKQLVSKPPPWWFLQLGRNALTATWEKT
jgi:hypothetical protein